MLVLGNGCKYRLSLAERFDCTDITINQLLAELYQNPISEWQVKIQLHLVAGLNSESDTYCSPCVASSLSYLPLASVPLSGTARFSVTGLVSP